MSDKITQEDIDRAAEWLSEARKAMSRLGEVVYGATEKATSFLEGVEEELRKTATAQRAGSQDEPLTTEHKILYVKKALADRGITKSYLHKAELGGYLTDDLVNFYYEYYRNLNEKSHRATN